MQAAHALLAAQNVWKNPDRPYHVWILENTTGGKFHPEFCLSLEEC
jgi:hypothetical protein